MFFYMGRVWLGYCFLLQVKTILEVITFTCFDTGKKGEKGEGDEAVPMDETTNGAGQA